MKVIYNACYGGFSLSDAGMRRYAEIKGIELFPEIGDFDFVTYWTKKDEPRSHSDNVLSTRDFERDDPALLQVVAELGDKANGPAAALRIVEVTAGDRWRIDEYDGNESVMTVDDYEWKVAT